MHVDPRVLTGRSAPEPQPRILHAGPVSAELDGADLRGIRVAGIELVQRVYVAVRDAPWNTIPATFTSWAINRGEDSFRVEFEARHAHESIDFEWHGRIEGTPDGTIRYELDGVCHGVFAYSKIGFNVHHALVGAIGRPYRARTEAGELRGTLPDEIDPQRIVGTTLSGMFDPYRELAIEVRDGLEAVVSLEGDLLELQDHRNWTDGNFKSYATPLALGFPFDSTDGLRIRQVLTISYRGALPEEAPATVPVIAVGEAIGPLPAVGFGQPSHGQPLTAREAALVAAVRPAHLRVDLVLSDPAALGALERAAKDARATGAGLELAVHANDASGPALDAIADGIRTVGVPVVRVLVYHLRAGFSALGGLTPVAVVALVREHLEAATGPVPFAGGTNQSFGDINRDRPTDPVFMGVCFSISPTVHAADDRSIVENLVGQSEVVRMARTFAAGRPVSVSPVTIATRFGPYPAGPPAPDDLPAAVDVRQLSLLGAAWTAGSLKHLAESGAASVTYYETSGWRGIVERESGSPDSRFPSARGATFPLYHVFADVAAWAGGTVRGTMSSRPLSVEALAVEDARGLHLLVANLEPADGEVDLLGITGDSVLVRTLDYDHAGDAMTSPAAFRARPGDAIAVLDGRVRLRLGPHAVARVDPAG